MKHEFEDVIEAHSSSDREIAKMISKVPLEIVKTQRWICGLGAALHFVGIPQFSPFNAVSVFSFAVAFVAIYFFAKFLELGIIFGGSFFRSPSKGILKFVAIVNGIIVLVLSAAPSILLGGMLFETISVLMHKTDLASIMIAYSIGAVMPTMQVLMQIYKGHREELVKESTNAQDLQKHMIEKKQEAHIADETMKAIERVSKDPQYQQQIDAIIVKAYGEKIRASFATVHEVEGSIQQIETLQAQKMLSAPTDQAKSASQAETEQDKAISENADHGSKSDVCLEQEVPNLSTAEDSISQSPHSQGYQSVEQSTAIPEASEIGPGYSVSEEIIDYTSPAYNEPEEVLEKSAYAEDDQIITEPLSEEMVANDHIDEMAEEIEQPKVVPFRQKQTQPEREIAKVEANGSQPKTQQVVDHIEAMDETALVSFLDRKNRAERKKVADHFGITERTLNGILKSYKDRMEAR